MLSEQTPSAAVPPDYAFICFDLPQTLTSTATMHRLVANAIALKLHTHCLLALGLKMRFISTHLCSRSFVTSHSADTLFTALTAVHQVHRRA